MSGDDTIRREIRSSLLDAVKHLRRYDHDAAMRAARRAKGNVKFPVLCLARRIVFKICRDHFAREFLAENVPPAFQCHAPDLYPDPDTLRTVERIAVPDDHDDDGELIPGFRGGLLFFGPTGSGKTRAAFRLLSAWAMNEEMRFRYFSAPVLKRQLADAARAGKAHQVIEQILEFDDYEERVIFIDDLSQARFTASFAENLFELIDRIHRERRLLIVTVQTTGAALVRKWCADDRELADTAEAIARRLKDYCVKVRFTKRPTPAAMEAAP
jgi:hypothetical protein